MAVKERFVAGGYAKLNEKGNKSPICRDMERNVAYPVAGVERNAVRIPGIGLVHTDFLEPCRCARAAR